MTDRLGAYGVFAGLLAAAGLPIYIHAPKFYVDSYGVSLTALGTALFVLRLLDVVQDPLLGRLAAGLGRARQLAAVIGAVLMAGGMVALFAIDPAFDPAWWFALSLTCVFSAFSFLNILFYATGVGKAGQMAGQGHLRLARWRETGALLGVCLAALLPTLLQGAGLPGFAGFAVIFCLAAAAAAFAMHPEWRPVRDVPATGFGPVLRDRLARRLLLIALLNAAPVAVSSTLFLFFVESRLAAPGWEGPLLLLFFFAAALAAPGWGLAAERFGVRPVLLSAMAMAIVTFAFALVLREGDVWRFALVCLGSGAALGADLTLLPAAFARRMARISPNGSEGFALWSFVSKLTLAFAAIALLPVLEMRGFQSGAGNSEAALQTLTLLYAGVPCGLKLVAALLLLATRMEETV